MKKREVKELHSWMYHHVQRGWPFIARFPPSEKNKMHRTSLSLSHWLFTGMMSHTKIALLGTFYKYQVWNCNTKSNNYPCLQFEVFIIRALSGHFAAQGTKTSTGVSEGTDVFIRLLYTFLLWHMMLKKKSNFLYITQVQHTAFILIKMKDWSLSLILVFKKINLDHSFPFMVSYII